MLPQRSTHAEGPGKGVTGGPTDAGEGGSENDEAEPRPPPQ